MHTILGCQCGIAFHPPREENAMATVTVLKALTNYFNVGDGKRPMKAWSDEMKALSPEEKRHLAELVCAATGDELA